MKEICLVSLLVMSLGARAQTWNEWFRQKKTQIQYLKQQVAGLQIYAEYLGKGYQIARTGLQTIGNIRKGEWNLHQTFISSLSKVNPAIKKDTRIAEIIALQLSIFQQYRKCFNIAGNGGVMTPGELIYIHSVFNHLLSGCGNDINDLLSIATDDRLVLSDGERLKRLASIYQSMEEKYQFAKHFCSEVSVLSASRQNAQREVNNTKTLFNFK